MKKLIIATFGLMMALSTSAFAAPDAENTDSTKVDKGHTWKGEPKKVTTHKMKVKGATGEKEATVKTTEVSKKNGKTETTEKVEAEGSETK